MRKLSMLIGVLLYPAAVLAAWFGAEFSADMMAYDSQWQQWQSMGRIYVGKNQVRMDMQQGNQQIVNILDAKTHSMYSLNPSQRVYMEMGMPPDSAMPLLTATSMPGEPGSLCQQPKVTCHMLGEEKINGVPAQKWELVDERDKLSTLRSLQWLDPTRKLLIKSEEPGAVSTELKYLGETTIAGRKVEKWESTRKHGDRTQRATSYIDPVLHVVVRQESGNQVTALNNIQVKAQPPSLFELPKDYRKVTAEEIQRRTGSGATSGALPAR
jgi:uncharacterized protein DUF4412